MSVMVSKLSVLPIDPVSVLSSLLLLLSSGGIWVSVFPVSVLSLSSRISVLSSSGGSRENAAISSLGAGLGVDPVSLASFVSLCYCSPSFTHLSPIFWGVL
jgi:hypothetical protein